MILEKEDWEEPECCFRPHIAAAEAVHTGSADGGALGPGGDPGL